MRFDLSATRILVVLVLAACGPSVDLLNEASGERTAPVDAVAPRATDRAELTGSAGVTHNLFSSLGDIAGVDIPGWTTNASLYSVRSFEHISTVGGTLTYTRNDAELDVGTGEAWQLEAIVMAAPLASAGECGARLWVRFFDANAPAVPPNYDQHRLVELHLLQDAQGNRSFALFDGATSSPKASLALDWTQAGSAAYRVRIKRQWDGADSWIWLQAETSSTYDDPAAPNVVSPTSQRVLLSSFGMTSGTGTTYGFGNAVAGSYTSTWRSVLLTRCDNAATVLPYWPAMPPAPDVLSHVDGGLDAPQGVHFETDLSTQGYLDTDRASLFLNADGGDIAGPVITNPSAAPGLHSNDFSGLSDDQNALSNAKFPAVTGWIEVSEAAGRTRIGTAATTEIPDETRPVVVVRIEQQDAPGVFVAPLAVYDAATQPTAIAVDISERHLDPQASSLAVNGASTFLSSLSATTLGPDEVRYVWPVASIPGGLREWDGADPVASLNQIAAVVLDDTTNEGAAAQALQLNTVAPAGDIVMSPNTGAPPLGDFVAIPAAPGNLFDASPVVGVRLTAAQIADLHWGDGSQAGPYASVMTLDGTPHPLDLAAGFGDATDDVDHVIYWITPFQEGTHTVSFELCDVVGNSRTLPSASFVVDLTAPTLTCPADVDVEATDGAGAPVTYEAATALDAIDPAPTLSYSVESGAVFAIGTTQVSVDALDAAGNLATCTFDVTVRAPTPPEEDPTSGCSCRNAGAGEPSLLLLFVILPWLAVRRRQRHARAS